MRKLIEKLSSASGPRVFPKYKRMQDYDWEEIAKMMGGKLRMIRKSGADVVEIFLGYPRNATYRFYENGGEINITKEASVGASVPYTAQGGYGIGPYTLNYRLQSMIDGEPIDYEKNFDFEE